MKNSVLHYECYLCHLGWWWNLISLFPSLGNEVCTNLIVLCLHLYSPVHVTDTYFLYFMSSNQSLPLRGSLILQWEEAEDRTSRVPEEDWWLWGISGHDSQVHSLCIWFPWTRIWVVPQWRKGLPQQSYSYGKWRIGSSQAVHWRCCSIRCGEVQVTDIQSPWWSQLWGRSQLWL